MRVVTQTLAAALSMALLGCSARTSGTVDGVYAGPSSDGTSGGSPSAASEVGAGSSTDYRPDRSPVPGIRAPEKAANPADRVRALLQKRTLVLSTHDRSSPDRFQFTIRVTRRVEGGELRSTNVLVARDGGDVGVLCLSGEGLPYCYSTNDFLVMVDHARPGGLAVSNAGNVAFRLASDLVNDKLLFDLGHLDQLTAPSVVLDAGSLLQSTVRKMEAAEFDAKARTLRVQTKQAHVDIKLPADPGQEVPFRDFVLDNTESGTGVSILNLSVAVAPTWNLSGVTKATIASLGAPVRRLTKSDFADTNFFVPAGFGGDPRERALAKAILGLLLRPPGPDRPPPPAAQQL